MKGVVNMSDTEKILDKLDVLIALVFVNMSIEKYAQKTKKQQIVELYKMGLRNKIIASLFGIKPQQVNNAILEYKKRNKK